MAAVAAQPGERDEHLAAVGDDARTPDVRQSEVADLRGCGTQPVEVLPPGSEQRRRLVDHRLAVEVAAALRVDLVLDVGSGEAGILECLDGPGDVHRLAEPGVGVDDRGQLGHPRDLRSARGDLGQRREPDVGQTQVGRQHRTRDVDALEALLLDEPGAERVERAGEAQQLPRGEPRAERPALLVRGRGGVQHQNSP